MKFEDLVEELAEEELEAALDALEAEKPEPVPELEWGAITSVDEAQQRAHELFPGPGGATAWLVDTVGISARSARRWMQTGECPHGRETRLMTAVENETNRRIREANAEAAAAHAAVVAAVNATPKGKLAAARLAAINPTWVSVGDVDVTYGGGAREESRTIGDADIDWDDIRAALDDGKLDLAAETFSREVLEHYGAGLGYTLTATKYDRIDLL